jgi:hypothetical protein
MEKQGSNKSKIWIVLFAISALFNIYQWRNHTTVTEVFEVTKDSLITARVDVEKELGATIEELNKYKGINENLDSLLAEANNKIEEQKDRINRLIKSEGNSAALNKKLMAELESLKKLRDEYLDKIDALMVENQKLKDDNAQLTGTVKNLSKNLEATVNTASVLKSEYFKINTFKKKGNGKYTSTALSKRTNKIDICFTVLENKIAKAGEKNVYLRIVEPGGKVMGNRSSGSVTFKSAGGEEIMCTAVSSLRYENNNIENCMSYEENDRIFTSGTYVIEVYIDGNLSGATSYVLR